MTFKREIDFEKAVIDILSNKGWEHEVIKNPTEQDLLNNWATILFENNRGVDRLNDQALTQGEMLQIVEQITELKTPLKLNGFINGKTVSITRDNPADTLHYGNEVGLKIYDRREIAAGQSRYQIAQQPRFPSKSKMLNDRRGDLMLLINGMPLIHIELKRSGVPVSKACNQIEKYSDEGIFTGLFSLVQIFVAMEPDETLYFANPGADGKFNKDYYFHWADVNNEPINDWKEIAASLLSIPMAHQVIGFYTVADDSDGVLKVMRSYQYFAANAISDKVSKTDWKDKNLLGGYIWHTTGSGKTMTSFKSAQLIANSKDADKVVFLMDRIELGTQSLEEYQGFADDSEDVQATENTGVLVTKLKSTDPANTLIVTSIQKMSNINKEEEGLKEHDINLINDNRIVFIIDEAHRSTFGDMLIDIKKTFSTAVFFGFTGTPIQEENQIHMNTTATVFGDELHRYSIADGIRDGNVLGFDPYKVSTYKDRDLRREVALMKSKSKSESEAYANEQKKKIFNKFMTRVPMAGSLGADGQYTRGIEDEVPSAQYRRPEHHDMVVKDILENWITLSQGSKFHAIYATSSISEAIQYYRLLKKQNPELKTTALFDPTIDNEGDVLFKQEGLVEIMEDYNSRYGQDFTLATHGKFKKDISARLAHKHAYLRVDRTPDQQLDLLIVVDQMLTGFDSKWVNTLYLDKVLEYQHIIQAFSRTNRLFGPDKPFGTIRYYRYPHTMERNIDEAVTLYSGNKATGLFAERLDYNLGRLNAIYTEVADLFTNADIENFEKLPDDNAVRGRFANLFKNLNIYLEAAKIQGFHWDKLSYEFFDENGKSKAVIELEFDQSIYLILALRYKELFTEGEGGGSDSIPFEIEGYLTEIDTGVIDAEYMNSRFEKFLKTLTQGSATQEEIENTKNELHKSFATLTQDEQKYASIFLHDIERGEVTIDAGKSFRDYVTEYQFNAKNAEISNITQLLGLDENKLRNMMKTDISDKTINDYGHFDELKNTVDKAKAKAYFEEKENIKLPPFKVNIRVHNLLQKFIICGGFDVELSDQDIAAEPKPKY